MKHDEIATTNKQHWENMVKSECGFTCPWLNLDIGLIRQYASGQLEDASEPLIEMYPSKLLTEVEDKDVLCLAVGGGQQSAVFGLLGARVTVVDLAEGQLDGDRKAAAHYGYEVTTIQADMRNLSCLDDDSFDLVYGTGMCYVPDVRNVYSGVARVLRTGGVYRVDFANPATEFVDCDDWDGEGYRITRPYSERSRRRNDGAVEFRHYLGDIFNGLLAVGLSLQQVQESPHYHRQNSQASPGDWTHWLTYVVGFAIVAKKT
ncbi:MAG: class I SAM-dependent methyltransferase [Candidatus Poribacteria bacterium]